MTPEEVQKLLDEQRAQILAEVDARIAASIQAERDQLKLRVLVNSKAAKARNAAYYSLSREDREVFDSSRQEEQARQAIEDDAEIERLKGIVPEKDWPN